MFISQQWQTYNIDQKFNKERTIYISLSWKTYSQSIESIPDKTGQFTIRIDWWPGDARGQCSISYDVD